jgi:CNT family concentrative nucleoside transporter
MVLIGIAWLLSERRSALSIREVLVALAIQFGLALLLLKAPPFQALFLALNDAILALDRATTAGASFVFGYLGGGEAPFANTAGGSDFILAFRALPIILVMSALSALLFYWRILPLLVQGFAWLLQKTMGIGGALGLATAANLFVGMVESPLLIRPWLARMGRGELFALMTCGMATIAGTVMVLYAGILGSVIPDAMGHILTASLISAPAALLIARIMVPESDEQTQGELKPPQPAASAIDALTQGTSDGLKLFLNIIALLLVFVALVHLVNQILGLLPAIASEPLTLQRILGWLMAPIAWLIGIPWGEAAVAGSLLGIKTVLNELLAYLQMAGLPEDQLSERSRLIMTYALCGFANPGSLGIMIGGLAAMVPERRDEIIALGPRTILSGTLATCMTGAVVALVL